MDRETIEMLEKYGIIVECESPLEIATKEDPTCRATGDFAIIVIVCLRERVEERNNASSQEGT